MTHSPAFRSAMIVLTLAALATTGCKAFDPCPTTKITEDVGQLDGTWDLKFVTDVIGDSDVPYTPGRVTGPTLLEGSLLFHTDQVNKGASCTDVTKTAGSVMATFKWEDRGKTNSDWYGGRFEFDHKTGEVTLRAYSHSQKGRIYFAQNGDRVLKVTRASTEFKAKYGISLGDVTIYLVQLRL